MMITGATKIIGPVPGCNLDPFLLARSQTDDSRGFTVIAYTEGPALVDILFLKGQKILHAARMGPKCRFILDASFIQEKFAALRSDRGTRVYYFSVPEESMNTFVITFYAEPFVKFDLAPLSRRQRLSVLEKNVHAGTLVEIDRYAQVPPSIHLVQLNSAEEIRSIRPLPQEGLLFLYDIGANIALLQEKERYGLLPNQASASADRTAEGAGRSNRVDPAQQELFASNSPLLDDEGRQSRLQTETQNPEASSSATRLSEEDAELVRVMKDLITRFKHEVGESLGNKRDLVLDRGEEEMRNLVRGFDSSRLTLETAAFAFRYVRTVAMRAPFFKRSLVRWIAEDAISQVYSKHYDVLQMHNLVETAETEYYWLKKRRKIGWIFL